MKRFIFATFAFAILAAAGCAGETGVRLVVNTDITVPDDMDEVVVTVYAGPGASVFSERREFPVTGTATFPITVGVKAGSTHDGWVMFRVQGFDGTTLVVERFALASFVDGEVSDVVVNLEAACRNHPCPGGEQCSAGECVGFLRPADWPAECGDGILDAGEACDDGNTTDGDGCSDTCELEGAECGDSEVTGTEECDDGNTTADDGCENDCTFSCHAASDCDDSNVCTVDTCDAVTAGRICNNTVDEGAACDDGNACTEGDACDDAGLCQPGATNICPCDPEDDTCEEDNGDGNVCNGTLHCADTGGGVYGCEVDGGTILGVGASCDDGIYCNGADTCNAAHACVHPGDPCPETCRTCNEGTDVCDIEEGSCYIASTCYEDGDVNPTDPCEACDSPTVDDDWTALAEGAACDDGDACTEDTTCDDAGACTGGTPVCACDPLADTCEADHGDDNPCNGTQACTDTGGGVYACAVDPATFLAEGASCDDAVFCNGADLCGPAPTRSCLHGGDPCPETCRTCNEGTDVCDVDTGFCFIDSTCYAGGIDNPANDCQECVSATAATAWTNKAESSPCNDGLFCNGADACDAAGACVAGAGDPCPETCRTCNETDDRCDVSTGCFIASTCYAEGADDPANPCRECVAATSAIAWTNKADGAACDDTLFCTGVDTCNASGTCLHAGDPCAESCRTCDEGTDLCNIDTGSCFIDSTCYADGTDHPSNDCMVCDTATSATTWTAKANGTACAGDSDPCTVDTCSAGTCGSTSGCTAGVTILSDHRVRLCVTQAACNTAISGTCTTVHVPGDASWNSWTPGASNLADVCTGYYAFTTTAAVAAGSHCYKFVGNGTEWFSDPSTGADCSDSGGAAYCDPTSGNPNCRFVIP